jgi:hypothetical protein
VWSCSRGADLALGGTLLLEYVVSTVGLVTPVFAAYVAAGYGLTVRWNPDGTAASHT